MLPAPLRLYFMKRPGGEAVKRLWKCRMDTASLSPHDRQFVPQEVRAACGSNYSERAKRMDSLFEEPHPRQDKEDVPLAERMRPATLEGFVGQEHLLGPGKALRRAIENDQVPSMILWGPPGVGKTTLAQIIAHQTRASFLRFSAVVSGIKEIREIMASAERARRGGHRTILLVTRSIASTRRSRMRSCRTSKKGASR